MQPTHFSSFLQNRPICDKLFLVIEMATKKLTLDRALSAATVILWMGVIFLFSAQTGNDSGSTSGGIVRWLVNFFHPHFSQMPEDQQMGILVLWHTLIRKGAHFSEYAILGALLCNALRTYNLARSLRWLIPVAGSALYAISDELHQFFVPDRVCSIVDVGIDTAGAIFGIALFSLFAYLIKKRAKTAR